MRHLLKMLANVYQNPILDNPSAMDAYSNAVEPVWNLIVESEKCLIQPYELRSGDRKMIPSGPENKNMFIGYFINKRTIGQRVVVTSPLNVFPLLYIKSESPGINALTGRVHHYEYLLELERP